MDHQTARRIFIVTCVSYVAFGASYAALGPLLAQFAENNHVSLSSIGGVYTANFIGSILSQLLLGRHTDRWGHLKVYALALLCLAFGYIGVSLSHWFPLTLACAFIGGLGFGLAVLCSNVMIGRIYKEKSVSALNLTNMFFGLGDVIGPLLVSLFLLISGKGTPALWTGSILIIVSALIFILFFFNVPVDRENETGQSQTQGQFKFTPFLISLGAIMLIYAGCEASMGGWTTTYMQGTTSLVTETAALVTSGYWLAFSLGRGMGAFLGSRIQPTSLLKICFGISLLGTIIFIAGIGNLTWSIIAILVIGFGFSATFPTLIAITTSTFADAPGRATSIISILGSVGSSFLPWLVGVTMENAGMRFAPMLMCLLVLLMIAAYAINRRIARTAAPVSTESL